MSKAIGLPDSVVHLNEPRWGYAETVNLGSSTGLLMWYTTALRPDDSLLANVRHLLDRSRVETFIRAVIDDEAMMWGELQAFVGLLHPPGGPVEPSPAQRFYTDVFESWGSIVKPAQLAAKMHRRCRSTMTQDWRIRS